MTGVKVLQLSTVLTFIIFAGVGLALVIFAPEKIGPFTQLLQSIWPLFVAEVIPAFLGTPLKEYIAKKGA